MNLDSQTRLVGEETSDSVTIKTDARVFVPFLELPTALVKECKLRVSDDGMRIQAVGPANVAMVDVTIHADALDRYETDLEDEEMIVGLNLETLEKNLSSARIGKQSKDDVELYFDQSRSAVEITREYGSTTISHQTEWLNLDADAIREEPDPVEGEFGWMARFDDPYGFAESVYHIDRFDDALVVEPNGVDLVLRGTETRVDEDEREHASITRAQGVIESSGGDSGVAIFSIDFLSDIADAIHSAKMNEVQLEWSEEFPVIISSYRDGEEATLYDVEFMLAPRIGEH